MIPREAVPRSLLYALGFTVVTVGVVMFLLTRRNDRRQHDGAGAPVEAMVVDSPAGPVLVVNDSGNRAREQWARLTAVDAKEGKRLATRVERTKQIGCTPARGGRLWCRLSRLVLVDARTLADVTDVASAITKAGLASPLADQVTLTDDAAFATLANGRIARLDASTLAVTEVKAAGTATPLSSGCDLQTELNDLRFSEGTLRKVFARGGIPLPTAAELLRPRFLATDSRTRAPLSLGADVLVHHDSSLDASATTLLSRTQSAGTLRWTAELGGPCQIATLVDQSLVVATTNGARRARSLDLATGAIRWQLQFD